MGTQYVYDGYVICDGYLVGIAHVCDRYVMDMIGL